MGRALLPGRSWRWSPSHSSLWRATPRPHASSSAPQVLTELEVQPEAGRRNGALIRSSASCPSRPSPGCRGRPVSAPTCRAGACLYASRRQPPCHLGGPPAPPPPPGSDSSHQGTTATPQPAGHPEAKPVKQGPPDPASRCSGRCPAARPRPPRELTSLSPRAMLVAAALLAVVAPAPSSGGLAIPESVLLQSCPEPCCACPGRRCWTGSQAPQSVQALTPRSRAGLSACPPITVSS